ncbi:MULTISPECIES: glycosyltransferase family 4 protein [Paenibacillus]|uniref:glycosyltransferase family 4 protein n=1 Tax=Paenibacillus TaxID=44249 RepID=UPI000CF85D8D|nr:MULTISPECIES: glycosyltransferase family 4 protein [Paenibacillus]PQP86599.1 spore coat protein [Paenibacillus sp. AR247]GIO63049.1 spore coat protein SA [Paenibacillus cineris]
MNILIVAPERLPVPGSGSVEICILSIARQLAKKHAVTVLSRASAGLPLESTDEGVRIVRVRSGSSKVYLASVLRFIHGKTYDVIQVDNRPHYMAAIQRAVPQSKVTLFLHSLTFVPSTRLVAASLKHAWWIVANSASLKQKLSVRFPSQAHKIRTVELGVDTDRFRPPTDFERAQARSRYGIGDVFTVLFTGRIIPRKGVPVLLKAAQIASKQVPLHLVIAGRSKEGYIRKLKAEAAKLRVAVTWTGNKNHSEIHSIYRMADCFVCPSQRHEAFGLVNVEAMASGLPVIASQIGGIPEIIKHGVNGYLVDDYWRPEGFAEYLVTLAQSKELRRSLGGSGRSMVLQSFTWGRTAEKLAALYS